MSYAVGIFDGRGGKLRWLVPGRDYRLPRPEGPLTLDVCFEDYLVEHCLPSGGDPDRAWIAFRAWIAALGCNRAIATLSRADGRKVVQQEIARGVTAATARKHMAMGLAALNHAVKEERVTKVPKFYFPAAAQPRLRWLTREEHRKLMLVAKPWPRQLFWLLAFGTGARTGAMLDLDWDRVDLVRRTIDYRVPGQVYRNKRRAVVPINDALLLRLETAYAKRDPNCARVITRKGKPYSQGSLYHECKRDLAAIGIEERGVARHVARHTVASWILQDGGSIVDVARILGDTVFMVDKVYGHLDPSHLMKAANLL